MFIVCLAWYLNRSYDSRQKWPTMKYGYYISAKFDLNIMTKGIAE